MDELDLLSRLTVALAIGLLVGLERGWRSRDETDHRRAAGFRTFALSGLLGGAAGALSLKLGGIALGAIFLGFAAVFIVFHSLEARAEKNFSATGTVAGLLTFALGAMAVAGDLYLAIAAGVVMTILLALREPLHQWVASLKWEELRAVLILLAMTFLLLPVLPNRTVDPWGTINPYEIWLLAILIAAISFGGYVAVRILGDRLGVILTALAGGLASSTATTLTLARLGKQHPQSARLLAAGILIAGVVMMVRVGIVAGALNNALIPILAAPLTVSATILALGSGVLLLRAGNESETPALSITNPLMVGTALRLAALIGVVMLLAELFRRFLGDAGVLLVAALSGIFDVDAVTISMARLGTGISIEAAVAAILVAVAVNTISKAAMSVSLGGAAIGVPVAIASALSLFGGAAAAVVALQMD